MEKKLPVPVALTSRFCLRKADLQGQIEVPSRSARSNFSLEPEWLSAHRSAELLDSRGWRRASPVIQAVIPGHLVLLDFAPELRRLAFRSPPLLIAHCVPPDNAGPRIAR